MQSEAAEPEACEGGQKGEHKATCLPQTLAQSSGSSQRLRKSYSPNSTAHHPAVAMEKNATSLSMPEDACSQDHTHRLSSLDRS